MKRINVTNQILGVCFLLIISSTLLGAGVEWFDMGPLNGSANGHVWSKVLNDIGSLAGRNETWQVKLPARATLEVIGKCPDPYMLGMTVKWKTENGDSLEWALDQTAGGFYHKFSDPWDPAHQKDITVLVMNRHSPTDQKYQLIVNLLDPAGRPIGKPTQVAQPPVEKPASPEKHPQIAGRWLFSFGHPKGSIITIQQKPDGTVTSITCQMTFSNGDNGINKAFNLRWESNSVLAYSYKWETKSTPNLKDGEASIKFDSATRASVGARDVSGNSARDVLEKQ